MTPAPLPEQPTLPTSPKLRLNRSPMGDGPTGEEEVNITWFLSTSKLHEDKNCESANAPSRTAGVSFTASTEDVCARSPLSHYGNRHREAERYPRRYRFV